MTVDGLTRPRRFRSRGEHTPPSFQTKPLFLGAAADPFLMLRDRGQLERRSEGPPDPRPRARPAGLRTHNATLPVGFTCRETHHPRFDMLLSRGAIEAEASTSLIVRFKSCFAARLSFVRRWHDRSGVFHESSVVYPHRQLFCGIRAHGRKARPSGRFRCATGAPRAVGGAHLSLS